MEMKTKRGQLCKSRPLVSRKEKKQLRFRRKVVRR